MKKIIFRRILAFLGGLLTGFGIPTGKSLFFENPKYDFILLILGLCMLIISYLMYNEKKPS